MLKVMIEIDTGVEPVEYRIQSKDAEAVRSAVTGMLMFTPPQYVKRFNALGDLSEEVTAVVTGMCGDRVINESL